MSDNKSGLKKNKLFSNSQVKKLPTSNWILIEWQEVIFNEQST